MAAAAKLVATSGPLELTIEKVAKAVQLSKGAVLYHFPSKDGLVRAMIETALVRFDDFTEVVAERDKLESGRYTRAYAKVLFHPQNNNAESVAGVLAAVTTNLSLLEPGIARHNRLQKRLENDGISVELATLIRLAAEGLYFTRAFGLAPLSDEQAAKVLKLLLELSQSKVLKKKK